MNLRLSFLTLGVQDIARARAFYQGLGLSSHGVSNEFVCMFQLPQGIVLALFGAQALAMDSSLPQGSGSRIAMACNLGSPAEVDAMLALAVRLGGTISTPAGLAPWGIYRGYFTDLDGHAWEVAFNDQARLDDQGGLWLQPR